MKKSNKNIKKENFNVPLEISVSSDNKSPDNCEEMVNAYGTYNIQPTADTENDFPAIAQGTPDYMAERPLEFFRDGDDENPAADSSDSQCF